MAKQQVTSEQARQIGDALGVDWEKVDIKEFQAGLEEEKEHNDVTGGDWDKIARIALAHLKEVPNYYSRLSPAMKYMASGFGEH